MLIVGSPSDARLFELVHDWLAAEWSFENVAFSGREIDWESWNDIQRKSGEYARCCTGRGIARAVRSNAWTLAVDTARSPWVFDDESDAVVVEDRYAVHGGGAVVLWGA